MLAHKYDRSLQELRSLSQRNNPKRMQTLLDEQRKLRRERDLVNAEIHRILSRTAEIRATQPLNVDEIRQALDPGTLMLSYSVDTEQTTLFSLTSDGNLKVYHLPVKEPILWQQLVRFHQQIYGQVAEATTASSFALGGWFYDRLLLPAAEELAQSRRLLIIPDGPLHYLPFAALTRKLPEDIVLATPRHPPPGLTPPG
jgi:CHAT domain-containing protein